MPSPALLALLALAFLVLFTGIGLISFALGRGMPLPALRALPAYERMRYAIAEAAETGRPVHLALGVGGISDASAMETVAGLTVLDYFSAQADRTATPPLVTTANPTTLVLAQELLSQPYQARDHLADFDPLTVRFIGGDTGQANAAYAAGVVDVLERRQPAANFMLGQFGDEYVLLSETAARNQIPQTAGSASLKALPFMALSTEPTLIGEELFAAGAYLLQWPWHIASLVTQDVIRWIIVATVAAVVALRTLDLIGSF